MSPWTTCRLCGKPTRTVRLAPRHLGQTCWTRLLRFVAQEIDDGPAGGTAFSRLLECSDAELREWIQQYKDEVGHTGESRPDPRRYVPPRVWRAEVRRLGKSEEDLIRKMGGQRALRPPVKPYWRPVYAGIQANGGYGRWLPREALAHLDEVKDAGPRRRRRRRVA